MGTITHETITGGVAGSVGYEKYIHADHHLIGGTAGLNIVRGATLVVAASNASAASKAQADYLCDGTADDVDILAAHDALPLIGGVRTGRIQLTEGLFEIAAMMTLTGHVELVGMGQGGFWETTTIGTTVLRASAASFASTPHADMTSGVMFFLNPATTQDHYMKLSNMKITMTGDAYRAISGIYAGKPGGTARNIWLDNLLILGVHHGVFYYGVNNGRLRDVWVRAVNPTGGKAFRFSSCSDMDANNIIGEGHGTDGTSTSHGLYFSESTANSKFRNSHFQRHTWGVYIEAGSTNIDLLNIWSDYSWKANLVIGNSQRILVQGGRYVASGVTADGQGIVLYGQDITISGAFIGDDQATPTQKDGIVEMTGADRNYAWGNDYRGLAATAVPITTVGTNSRLAHNDRGYISENSGTATVANGTTSIVVSHGLATTPTRVQITPRENPTNAVAFWWVDTLTATQFTINVNANPGASGLDFDWHAQVGEG